MNTLIEKLSLDRDEKRKVDHWVAQIADKLVYHEATDDLRIKHGSGLGPMPLISKWNAGLVTRALTETRHRNYTWAMIPEFRLYDGGRSVDLFAISCGEQGGNGARVGYEIKVSKADYRSELKNPPKYLETMRYVDEFYYVAPAGVIDPHTLPPEAGLIEVSQDERSQWGGRWRAKTIVRASKRSGLIDKNLLKALAAGFADRRQRGENSRDTFGASGLKFECPYDKPDYYYDALVETVKKRQVANEKFLKERNIQREVRT